MADFNKETPNIMLGPCEVAGIFSKLEKGLLECGYKAQTEFLYYHKFSYDDFEKLSFWKKLAQRLSKIVRYSSVPLILRAPFWALHQFIVIPIYFFYCVFKYDAFVFGFNKTFFPLLLDLPLLRMLGKRTVFLFFGSDGRPPYLNGAFVNCSPRRIAKLARRIKKNVQFIEKHCDYVVGAPSISTFFTKPHLNWFSVGVPVEITSSPHAVKGDDGAVPLILHAPSNSEIKGSAIVREAVRELANEGYEFSYLELSGKTNAEVLLAIARCSFVIDQLYSDALMSTFAAEAFSFGKPAIVGGYELEQIKANLRSDDVPPAYIIYPDKASLKAAIVNLLKNSVLRAELGEKAKAFVNTQRTPKMIGERMFRIISGDPDPDWYFDPNQQLYSHGCGISAEQRKRLVQETVRECGEKALRLDDKPNLKFRLMQQTECLMGAFQ